MQTSAKAPITKLPASKQRGQGRRARLTYQQYAAITRADNGNYERINGNRIFMPSPTPQHQRVVRRLSNELENHVRINDLDEVFFAPLNATFVDLKKKTIVQSLNETGAFQKSGTFNRSETLKSVVLEGFEVNLEDLM